MVAKAKTINKFETLASFIKFHRTKNGKSQAEVAEHMGYGTAQFISNWERGVSQPPVNQLKMICKFIGADADVGFELYEREVVGQVMTKLRREFEDVGSR